MKKETKLGMAYKKDENFGEWFSEVRESDELLWRGLVRLLQIRVNFRFNAVAPGCSIMLGLVIRSCCAC